jgi:hypothetical protein
MTNEQIMGVWDKWIVRGSDIDIDSSDPTSMFHGDPNKEELDFLKSVTNLSPDCSASPEGCPIDAFDVTTYASLNPDFTVYIHFGPYPEVTSQIESISGSAPIVINERFENTPGCLSTESYEPTLENCNTRSLMEVIARLKELTSFLGVEAPKNIADDQQTMCEAANQFSLMAEELQKRGIRCLAASVRTNNGGAVNVFNLNHLAWLRTFEELGLPLMHGKFDNATDFTKTYTVNDWYPGCEGDTNNCEDLTPIMPVDCFLFDTRSFAYLEENMDLVLSVLPEETVKAGQYSYFHFNEGSMSYRTVAAVLNQMTEQLKDSELLYSETPCAEGDVSSGELTSVISTLPGQYVCFEKDNLETEMLTCPEGFTPGATSTSGGDTSSKPDTPDTPTTSDTPATSNAASALQRTMKQFLIISCIGLASSVFSSCY